MSFIVAIILLGVVVFVHELGHFLACKMTGVKVEKFSIGFGPALLKKRMGDTEYILAAVPLGGYVKMLGEQKESEDEAPLTEEDLKRSFSAKPVSSRVLIVLMGPVFNIAFAVLVYWVLLMGGTMALTSDISDIAPDSPASVAGMKPGDKVVEMDGAKVKLWEEMAVIIEKSAGKNLPVVVERSGERISLVVTPKAVESKNVFGETVMQGKLGITSSKNTIIIHYGPVEALGKSIGRCVELTRLTFVAIWKLAQRIIPADTLGGPVMIVQMAERSAREGAVIYFNMMALISLSLGVFNLLPIPVLDGGHILFMGIEAVRKKPLSERVMEISQRVGIAVLLSLMLFVTYNDIIRIVSGKGILP